MGKLVDVSDLPGLNGERRRGMRHRNTNCYGERDGTTCGEPATDTAQMPAVCPRAL